MKTRELKAIIIKHRLWLKGDSLGKQADLRRANLQGANLQGADLRRANLRRADLDFSCLPLHCGSFGVKWDDRHIFQFAAHIVRADQTNLSDDAKQAIAALDEWKNKFCEYRDDIKEV